MNQPRTPVPAPATPPSVKPTPPEPIIPPTEPQLGVDTLGEKQQHQQGPSTGQYGAGAPGMPENAVNKHAHEMTNQEVRSIRNKNMGSSPSRDNRDNTDRKKQR